MPDFAAAFCDQARFPIVLSPAWLRISDHIHQGAEHAHEAVNAQPPRDFILRCKFSRLLLDENISVIKT
jgi:hypothetical protein